MSTSGWRFRRDWASLLPSLRNARPPLLFSDHADPRSWNHRKQEMNRQLSSKENKQHPDTLAVHRHPPSSYTIHLIPLHSSCIHEHDTPLLRPGATATCVYLSLLLPHQRTLPTRTSARIEARGPKMGLSFSFIPCSTTPFIPSRSYNRRAIC